MDYILAVLGLLGGLGAFLVGVNLLSDGTEQLANNKIKDLFNKTSKNKLVGVGIGALTTAIIQSSGATTVMIIGFVNAGVMTLFQATTLIMGANIGTTITAQLASLSAFEVVGAIPMAVASVGALIMMLSKKYKMKAIGSLLAGLGVVFVGLDFMSSSMGIIKSSPAVTDLLLNLTNPFLLLLIGAILTALVQSSSATTAIVISMAAAGMVIGDGNNEVLFLILGTNIGSCITALMSSIGATINARRASIIHLMFNVFGSIIFFVILVIWKDFSNTILKVIFSEQATQIAMFHTFFNVVCTMVFLPFTSVFVKLSKLIIKDKAGEEKTTFLDKRFIATPAIAIESVMKENIVMINKAMNSLSMTIEGFLTKNDEYTIKSHSENVQINEMSKMITEYLIQLSTQVTSAGEESHISILHSNNARIVRISELSDNINKYTMRRIKEGLSFSKAVKEQLSVMLVKIQEMSSLASEILLTQKPNQEQIVMADKLETEINKIRKDLVKGHMERLSAGECKAESSSVFISLVANLERIGDYLIKIIHSKEEM